MSLVTAKYYKICFTKCFQRKYLKSGYFNESAKTRKSKKKKKEKGKSGQVGTL